MRTALLALLALLVPPSVQARSRPTLMTVVGRFLAHTPEAKSAVRIWLLKLAPR